MNDTPRFGTAGLADSYTVKKFDPAAIAAYTAGFDFEAGLNILKSLLEGMHGLLAGLLAESLKRAVENFFSGTFLATVHETVDELGDELAAVQRIRQNFTLGSRTFTGHNSLLMRRMLAGVISPAAPGASGSLVRCMTNTHAE